MRIFVIFKKEDLVVKLMKIVEKYELFYEEFDFLDLLYVLLDSELVKNLLGIYCEIIGDMIELFVLGGVIFVCMMN